MSQQRHKPTVARRDVLRALAAGAGAAAVPLATGVEAAESEADKRKARYRVTDHIKAYYRVNQYPTK
ncbi:MAG TPA: formate dehydrogenase [Xanthobacteraceae bacterium]|nr:formate dehydrogenase [Xanthobacteraceae bacterium]